ncbi:MAG: type II secretion system protein GspM, partial [Candidatus Binatia bacterium]
AWLDRILVPIRQLYAGLAPRERRLVAIAGAALAVVVAIGIWSAVRSTRAGLERRIAAKEKDLAGIRELRETYLMLRRDTEQLYSDAKSRPADFSLFSFLEGIGSRAMPREKITAMNPSNRTLGEFLEDSVEMKISGVSLPELVELLYRLQRGPVPLRVARLTMRKRFNDPQSFDVSLSVSMLTRSST